MAKIDCVDIRIIDHAKQRYDTCGDWFFSSIDGALRVLNIRVSKMRTDDETRNNKMEHLIAVHEYIEAVLCNYHGVTEKAVTEWDTEHQELEEPGAHIDAPYYREHMFATSIEMQMAQQLEIDWWDYDHAVKSLSIERYNDSDKTTL